MSIFWTQPEKDILIEYYAARGAMGCLELLPGRTSEGISKAARILKLRYVGPELAALPSDAEWAQMLREWPAIEPANNGVFRR